MMVINGVEGKKYPDIISRPYFSPDGKSLVYFASDKNFWYVIDNDKILAKYDSPKYSLLDSFIFFSKDSKKLAYSVSEGQQIFFVINGVAGQKYDKLLSQPKFNEDLSKVVFLAQRGDKYYFVVNGSEQEETPDKGMTMPFISNDGSKIGYLEVSGTLNIRFWQEIKPLKAFFQALLWQRYLVNLFSHRIQTILLTLGQRGQLRVI
jgi:hypothetical protein